MKKIYFLLLAGMCWACSDFLEETPRTFLDPDVAYETEEGLSYGANGLYDRFSRPFFRDDPFGQIVGLWMCPSDIHHRNQTETGSYGIKEIDDLTYTSETGLINNFWEYYYTIITNAQLIINKSEQLEWTNTELENRVKGEAYFFRAYGHFYLTQFYGDIPIVDQLYDEVKLDWVRDPKSKVMEMVIADLKTAEEKLSYKHWNGQDGRVTKGTAQHLLAYAYLCNEDWENAEKYGKKLIESGYHQLMKSRFGKQTANAEGNVFWDLFQLGNHAHTTGNTEGLFVGKNAPWELYPEVTDGDDLGYEKGYNAKFVRFYYSSYYSSSGVIENDEEMLKYGGRGKGYILTSRYWLDSLFTDQNDIRGKYPCVQKKFERTSNGSVLSDWDKATESQKANVKYRPYPTKWNWDGESKSGNFGTDATTRDFYIFRLSETYLIVAEALHKQGNNSETNGAAYYINQVRERAQATPVKANEVSINYILDERARELFGEIPRRLDLIRTGKFVERVTKFSPDSDTKIMPNEKHNLLPIPQEIRDLNINLEMSQNEGW